MGVADEMLGSVGQPHNGTPKAFGRFENKRIFAMHDALDAKAAADVIGDDMQFLRRNVQDFRRNRIAETMHALAADMQLVASRG
jgi:hypothetical protein